MAVDGLVAHGGVDVVVAEDQLGDVRGHPVDGSTVTAKFDGVDGDEIIDRKLNPSFTIA
jgi:hypothetical protein